MRAPPETIGPYQILRKLGEGGMGAVYEGIHSLIERRVAIKILRPEYGAQPEFTARFFNEARAVNRVDHPGLVQISDYGQLPDSTAYIVMEYLNGESLATRLKGRGGPLPLEQALNLGSQLADALAAAHEKSIVHRDLKPDNVMIVADSKAPGGERTKLLDFGIAKLADDNVSEQSPGHVKTNTNSLMGTPYYMSPEQCRGAGKVDGRSDVYALGVMMYEILSGVRPITGEGQGDIIVKHLTEEPTPLRSRMPELPEAVTTLVHRMMAKDREKRPVATEVAIEFEALTEQFPPPSVRRTTASIPMVRAPSATHEIVATGTGTTAGQKAPPKGRGRSLGLAVLAGVALLAFSVIGVRSLRQRPVAPTSRPAAPRNIHWSIDSAPPDAEVIQASDGQVLGKTPWKSDRPAGSGTLKLKLRLIGYGEKEIELNQSADVVREETLVALSPPDPAPAAGGKKAELVKVGKPGSKSTPGAGKIKKGKAGAKANHGRGGRQIED